MPEGQRQKKNYDVFDHAAYDAEDAIVSPIKSRITDAPSSSFYYWIDEALLRV